MATNLDELIKSYYETDLKAKALEKEKKKLNAAIKSELDKRGISVYDNGVHKALQYESTTVGFDGDLTLRRLKDLGKTQYISEVANIEMLKAVLSVGLENKEDFDGCMVSRTSVSLRVSESENLPTDADVPLE